MKTIVITKNYYKVLEIIEFNSDKYKSEFKIVPMIAVYKMNMLFIKHEFYIAMITNRIIKFDNNNFKYVYEDDIDNLNFIEREKFLYFINKNIKNVINILNFII